MAPLEGGYSNADERASDSFSPLTPAQARAAWRRRVLLEPWWCRSGLGLSFRHGGSDLLVHLWVNAGDRLDNRRSTARVKDGKALLLAVKHQPEVVLLKLMMPQVDGYEVAGRLRKDV